jgi:signal transduction histidine kinase
MAEKLERVLEAVAAKIVERFVDDVQRIGLHARPIERRDVANDLEGYLRHVVRSLRTPESGGQGSESAREHGAQRWALGVDLRRVVIESSLLRGAILSELEAQGVVATARELNRIADLLDAGLADALVQFSTRSSAELSDALAAANRATLAREDVIAVVSHDLKNPLQVVLGSATLLKRELESEDVASRLDRMHEGIDRIVRAGRRMDMLIEDLLVLARLKSGEVPLNMEEHPPTEIVRDAWEHAQPLAEARSVELVLSSQNGGLVCCDRDRIRQVLANIIGNAIKFTRPGSTVTIGCSSNEHEWTFTVTDEGPGIPKERLDQVFTRFWQAPGVSGGTGLGLSIAKGLVELHGGRIWAHSPPAQGATFAFTLPRVR